MEEYSRYWLEREITEEVRKSMFSLSATLILKTAVRDGYLRTAWLISDSGRFAPTNNNDKNTGEVVSEANEKIKQYDDPYGELWLTNSQPYAYRIMETGYSMQTPPKTLSLAIQKAQNL